MQTAEVQNRVNSVPTGSTAVRNYLSSHQRKMSLHALGSSRST